MIARFPGICGCGCGRRFAAGAELVRLEGGVWALAGCRAAPARPAPLPAAPASSAPYASAAEILDILDQAKRIAARVERETAARLGLPARAAGAGG
jgi:hypothetical protein